MFVAVLVRRLKPGMTYEDFLRAWYPDKGSGLAGPETILGRNLTDESEILALTQLDLPDVSALQDALQRIGEQEAVRQIRMSEVVESTTVRSVYEVTDEFDLSTDEAVAAGRARLLL
ncbi:hypothetical protein [Microbaculum marinum]|uniref:EthD domain-containing protein n=1 Tax=Microbaculum marinum TaxID=1764581 RepID=A0AAW9RY05_9HYPH